MRTSNTESLAKIELLIEFLQQKKPFDIKELTTQLAMSKTMPYILMRSGYVKRIVKDQFEPTDLVDGLTADLYRKLSYDYNKENRIKRAEKKSLTKQLSISDFLKSKMTTKDGAKELAAQIYNIIKSYL